jgi:hypothetical protein
MRVSLAVSLGVTLIAGTRDFAVSQPADFEYRVVFASAQHLARQLDEAGHDGYACVAVAHAEPGTVSPGIVVLLGRTASRSAAVPHQVIVGGRLGTDLQPLLDRAGESGFRLCGIVLAEGPPGSSLVAVMSQSTSQANTTWHYGVEVLTSYKSSLVRLNAAARDGFRAVAAEAVDNSRVPAMRSFMVVTERPESGNPPSELMVRSSSGADGLQKAMNEQGRQGFHADLVWKEGNDVVAMMSHALDRPTPPVTFLVTTADRSKIHFMSGLYLADVPYLSAGDRLLISDQSTSAENDLVEDPLPRLGGRGHVDAATMQALGDHITRNRGYAPVAATIRAEATGRLVLATVVTKR